MRLDTAYKATPVASLAFEFNSSSSRISGSLQFLIQGSLAHTTKEIFGDVQGHVLAPQRTGDQRNLLIVYYGDISK
ncbi:hypothetical protein NP233_g12455 [Leucocoprinus birnbaumii]|uniref:Uncharacterized protein n=1 Tax=Leucocoprinus birnbaumii TaxID=56174 RepID=A0AAD5VGA5_9AGAR|nr:hypothetical protein NP233_g12455 [Leucocoprinus birnbaumii]